MKTLILTQPDDWHLHLRDGEYLSTTVAATASCFARALVMPNLNPPLCIALEAESYHQRIKSAIPATLNFTAFLTLYLTPQTSPADIQQAKQAKLIAVKYYPAGATTHSTWGVKDITALDETLAAMQEYDVPLLVHAETPDPAIDIFERESHFLANTLTPLIKRFPRLRVVVEHVSSQKGVEWVKAAPPNVVATITAHHLALTRNDLLAGGLHVHHYCLPVVKTAEDRAALIAAATSGNPKFFLGTDSAPHSKAQKENACGSAGIFSAPVALSLYAEIFESANALDKLEGFASFFGADFYRVPRNKEKITLCKENWQVPSSFPYGKTEVIPLRAGETLQWRLC